jgi:hypothetical protein
MESKKKDSYVIMCSIRFGTATLKTRFVVLQSIHPKYPRLLRPG